MYNTFHQFTYNKRCFNLHNYRTRATVEDLFGSAAVAPFCGEVIGHFESGTLPIPEIQSLSGTAQLYHLLKISVPGTIFGKLVLSFATLSPHSIGPERAVSCHTTLKGPKQSCYLREAINSRMATALNSCGTAFFDPRPSVARILEKKNWRMRVPNEELCKIGTLSRNTFPPTPVSRILA